jgi:hypothetical protein
MVFRALDLMTKVSSRFVHEILPVATASVIGAMLVNHYGRLPASPPIVIQAQPSASEDAMVQSLRDEHELIASFVERTQEKESDAERSGSVGTQLASVAPIALSLADPPLPEPRPASSQKAAARLAPKASARKKSAPTEAPAPQPDPPVVASEIPPLLASSPAPAQIEFEPRTRPIIRVAGAVGEWVADVAQAPARVAFLSHLPDWPSMPPVDWTLGFFRQN